MVNQRLYQDSTDIKCLRLDKDGNNPQFDELLIIDDMIFKDNNTLLLINNNRIFE